MELGGSPESLARRDAAFRAWLTAPPTTVASDLRRVPAFVARAVPQQARLPVRRVATRALAPLSRRRLRDRVAGLRSSDQPVLLHIGCGAEHKDGFVNIDLIGTRAADVALDLTGGLPAPSGSVDGIFTEHFLGHIALRSGFALLRECLRVLRPGGVLRVAVPDVEACISSYATEPDPLWDKGEPLPLMAVETLFYSYTLTTMYDEDKLTSILRVAGFREVSRRDYGETQLPRVPDTPFRRPRTLYVEGIR